MPQFRKNSIVVAVSMDGETLALLDALVSQAGGNRSKIVRDLILSRGRRLGLRTAEQNGAELGRKLFRLQTCRR